MRELMSSPIPVIGLYSPYPQAGKSTLADLLVEDFGFRRVKMAGALKAMLRALLFHQGVDLDRIHDMIEGSEKECVTSHLGFRSPRYAMQTLGTEWGRSAMGEDFWTSLARRKIDSIVAGGKPVVVDDMRFENEAHMIREFGGAALVRITRPSVAPKKGLFGGHKSEGGLEGISFDLEITNRFPSCEAFCGEAIGALRDHLLSKGFHLVKKGE